MAGELFSCVVIGEEPLLAESTRLLLARGHTVAAVVSPSAELLDWAESEGLPAVPFGRDLAGRLAPLRFDYLFSIANSRMLPDEVLALPARLPVNFHDGPLPRHAGLFATSWAILEGDKTHGVTWHVMTSDADTGDVLKQRTVPVDPAATVHDLDIACFDAGIESFAELVEELAAGTATRTPQDLGLRTYHGRYDGLPRAGVFDWRQSASELDAIVRATAFGRRRNDLGTALLALGDGLVTVRGVEVTDRASTAEPGTVIDCGPDALTVATGDRDVRLTDLADLKGDRLDLSALADALAREHGGRFPRLPDAAVEEMAEAGRAAHRQERYWLRVLDTLEPVLPPQLGPLPATARPAGPVALPEGLRSGSFAPEQTALAAVLAFLARLSRGGERDIAVSAPQAASRAAACLLAPEVPLRTPDGLLGWTLPELADRVGAELAQVRIRSPFRRDVLLRHPHLAGVARAGLPVAVLLPDSDAEPGERALTIRIEATGAIRFHGGTELAAEQESWLAERFALFLTAAAAEPHRPLESLPLLTPEERGLLLGRWNDTAEEYPHDRTVTRLISDIARAAPERTAVRFEDQSLTFGELDRAADRLARHLADLGAGPGTLVGVYQQRSLQLLVSLLAVLKSGAACLPVDPLYPPARIAYMVEDSGARLVLTDGALGGTLTDFPVTVVPVASAAPSDTPPDMVPAEPFDRSAADAAAYVIYTSGSTGLPKGVQIGHRALVNALWSMARRVSFGSRDSLLALASVCFDMAVLELYMPLVRGGTVEVLPDAMSADGIALRERIEARAPTVLVATPTTWQMLLVAGWSGDSALRVVCGGEPVSSGLADELTVRVGALYNGYGPTETTICSTIDRVRPGEPVTIGRPMGNTRCHVLDERGVPVPPGVPGELYLSGDGVADGYLGRPELTSERFVAAPEGGTGRAYRTGDLVRYLPDGRLQYLERIDGQIKLNGYRIELGEVESILREMPGVTAAVAVVREDRPKQPQLVAYVTGTRGPSIQPDLAELRASLRERLPAYMVPATVMVLPRLPLTPNGKIDRKALPKPGVIRIAGGAAAVRTDLERRIAEVWCEALGLEWVGAEDNFFDVGGDSLRLTSVAVTLRERLGLSATRLDMFGHPTVRAMAAHLSGAAEPATGRQRRSRDVEALTRRRERSQR